MSTITLTRRSAASARGFADGFSHVVSLLKHRGVDVAWLESLQLIANETAERAEHDAATFWLNTATGGRFNFMEPDERELDIVDIALSLSHQARYAGHTLRAYSVAEHSLVVLRAAEILGLSIEDRRWALMHDAAEAYTTDVPWPLKAAGLAPELGRVEKAVMVVIAARYGLLAEEPAVVKELDLEVLDCEAEALLLRHLDWPRGTPRKPREAVSMAFDQVVLDGGEVANSYAVARTFIRQAGRIGVITETETEEACARLGRLEIALLMRRWKR